MLNAFVIMLLVVCIYAVLAVDLYSQYFVMINPGDPNNPDITSRGDKYSEEYYGNFLKSLFTLFQILTGESWSEMGVRPILEESPDVVSNIGSAIFFTSFVLINSMLLLNVVVAVLLDGMAAASDEAEGSDLIELDSHLEEYHKGDLNGEEDGEATKEDENPDLGSDDCDGDEEAIQKDMAVLTQQVDSMSVQLKEVLTGLRMLEEQQRSKDPAINSEEANHTEFATKVVAVLLDGMVAASESLENELFDLDPHLHGVNFEEDGEAKKEQNENPDLVSNDCDDNGEAIRKDMAVMKRQVDTMSLQIKELLTGVRLLEESQPIAMSI
eukprot:CAMPEP_0172934890 /NCGR_PEP_ID=MMETSP1075-20121228/221241_1 /TAXON_ID=2916 /ORGANISM="Ceratium fusus, Strain PA161109" /LENGTH=325 /DNA_ID=CAMNT_0013796249 /DNA_START=145 /DNA_END=1123 /DNA_ORIENTATION=+